MAASDARPVPRKNAAFRFYFAIRKPSDSTLITTWAGMDSEVSLDGGSFSDCSNEATEIGTTGCGYIDLTSSEMNADAVVLKVTVTNTGAVPLVFTLFPEEAGDYRVSDTQKVDVETIKTQALTAAAGITFPASIASPTNITAATGVTLAAVTHTGAVIPTVSTVTNGVTLAETQPAITFGAVTIDVSGSTPNITLTGSGSGNGIEWTRSGSGNPLDADVVDQIQSGLSTLDASGVRSAVGLASANLDTQLGDIPTFAEFEARSIVAANYATSSALSTVEGKIDTIDNFIDTEVLAIKAVTDKIDTGLVLDGAVYQFTANMLELAPAGGGGGGGSGDATLAKQEEILTQLDVIQAKTDTIGSVGAITSLLAAAVLEPGTITSFPETLTIGDSYTEQNGREIQIPIVDTDGTPLSSTGSLNFADASVTFTLQRSGETDSTRVITGTATFVDPPGTGTGAGAPYAVIELPASETAKGLKKYKYSGILTFLWTYAGTGTADDVMSFETDTVTFEGQ
jgi:hypothetical protein